MGTKKGMWTTRTMKKTMATTRAHRDRHFVTSEKRRQMCEEKL
jgi:hypothetical protein